MWLYLVPILMTGIFLFIIWDTISPIRYIQQQKRERLKRRETSANDDIDDDFIDLADFNSKNP